MKTIQIPYYKGTMDLHVSEQNLKAVITAKMHEFTRTKGEGELVEEALANPIGTKRLSELAVGNACDQRPYESRAQQTDASDSASGDQKGESGGGDYDPHRDRTAPRAYGRGAAPDVRRHHCGS